MSRKRHTSENRSEMVEVGPKSFYKGENCGTILISF